MSISEFLPLITGAIGGATSAGLFKGPIETLDNLWYIYFGHKPAEKRALMTIEANHNEQLFKESLASKVSEIDPENIQSPKLSIAGPAFENSFYYIDEDELRNMFSNLIASSMDKSKEENLHPSFLEIIKQLSPTDSQTLREMYIKKSQYDNAICNLSMRWPDGGTSVEYTNLYLGNVYNYDQSIISVSLVNLDRLGLIDLDYSQWTNNNKIYKYFENCGEYYSLTKKIESKNTDRNLEKKLNLFYDSYSDEFSGPIINKGIAFVTSLGKSFAKICLS